MKKLIPFSIAAAFAASGISMAQTTAFSTPAGYYQFDGQAGFNLFIPSLIESAVTTGVIDGSSATTVNLVGSLVPGALDAVPVAGSTTGAVFATHYLEFTSGANEGVVVDISSNGENVINLASDISDMNLANTETVVIRPHVTLGGLFEGSESSLSVFSDNATFYLPTGEVVTYTFTGSGNWSSDFNNNNGNDQPITPGTGFVLFLSNAASLSVVGEVKVAPTVVQLPAGVPSIVGPVNPLVGTTVSLNAIGFGSLAQFSDSITVYQPGPLTEFTTYLPLGDGNLTSDFSTATTDTFTNTTGAAVVPASPTSVILQPGFTISQ